MQVKVSLDVCKCVEEQYEVIIKLIVIVNIKELGEFLFLLEFEYVGVFYIIGIVEEQMYLYLMIECLCLIFLFVCCIVLDVICDGGFLFVVLDNIDFMVLYCNELVCCVQQQ